MTRSFPNALLAVHGAVTLAAAVVLAMFPAMIPATVGTTLTPQGVLLAYLLAGAELGIAIVSLGAARLTDRAALELVCCAFAIFHLMTAVLEVVYLAHVSVETVLIANIVVRGAAAVLFVLAWRQVRAR